MTIVKTITGLSALLALMACEPMTKDAMANGAMADTMSSDTMSSDTMMSDGDNMMSSSN